MLLRQFVNFFEDQHHAILDDVMKHDDITRIITQYHIDRDIIDTLVTHIHEFIINSIDNKVCQTSSTDRQLFFQKIQESNVTIEDFFLICIHVRESMINIILSDKRIINPQSNGILLITHIRQILSEINKIFDAYMSDVLKVYYQILTRLVTEYNKVVNASNIVSKTDTNGVITYVNDMFCQISGYKRAELIGKNHNIVRHPNMNSEAFKDLWETIQSGKIWCGVVENLAKNGDSYFVNATIVPIVDITGHIIEYVGIRHDITKIVQYEAELQSKIERAILENREKDALLLQQSKLASMGEMIGNIAHQWRQPLSILSMILDKIHRLYTEERLSAQDMDSSITIAHDTVEYMSQTIDDFRGYFKQSDEESSFLLEKVIRQTVNLINESFKQKGILLSLDGNFNYQLFGNTQDLKQVLINILNNAKDAITLNKIPNGSISITTSLNENVLSIMIQDNAQGIPEDIIERIFEPYFTTKHKSQGTGIGLYMSKKIVDERMKGTLSVVNQNGGACFMISLPYQTK